MRVLMPLVALLVAGARADPGADEAPADAPLPASQAQVPTADAVAPLPSSPPMQRVAAAVGPGSRLPAAPSAAPGRIPPNERDPLAIGRERYAEGDVAGTVAALTPWLESRRAPYGRSRTAGHLLLGMAHYDLQNWNLASLHFYRVRRTGGPLASFGAWYEALVDHRRGRHTVAVRECRQYLEKWPDGAHADDCLLLIGDAWAAHGNRGASVAAYGEYLDRHPDSPRREEIRLATALAYARTAPARGVALLHELALDHSYPSTDLAVAAALRELAEAGHEGTALPSDPRSRMRRAWSLRRAGKFDEAWEMFNGLAAEAESNPEIAQWVQDNEDRFAWVTRNYDVYANALAADYEARPDADVAWRIFVAWSRAGEWAKAAEWGRTGLDKHKGHWRWRAARDDMAWATMLAGEYAEAAQRWGELKKRGGEFGRKSRFYEGFCQLRAGDAEAAAATLEPLTKRRGDWDAPAFYWRAQALDALGQPVEAANARQRARGTDEDGWYVLLLDNWYADEGLPTAALTGSPAPGAGGSPGVPGEDAGVEPAGAPGEPAPTPEAGDQTSADPPDAVADSADDAATGAATDESDGATLAAPAPHAEASPSAGPHATPADGVGVTGDAGAEGPDGGDAAADGPDGGAPDGEEAPTSDASSASAAPPDAAASTTARAPIKPMLRPRAVPDGAQVFHGRWNGPSALTPPALTRPERAAIAHPALAPAAQPVLDTEAGSRGALWPAPEPTPGWAMLSWARIQAGGEAGADAAAVAVAEAQAAPLPDAGIDLPDGYLACRWFDRDSAAKAFLGFSEAHKGTWPKLPAVYDLAMAGLYTDAARVLFPIYEEWRQAVQSGSTDPRAQQIRGLGLSLSQWRPYLLLTRDHYHAARACWGLDKHALDEGERIAALRLGYPLVRPELVWPWARRFDVDPFLVYGIMRQESTYRNAALSPVGAIGLIQVMPSTGARVAALLGEHRYSPGDLEEPAINLRYGIFYLSRLLDRFDGNFPLAVASYNGGPHNVSRWYRPWATGKAGDAIPLDAFVETIQYDETRDYVKRVSGHYARYIEIYEGTDALLRLPLRPTGDDASVIDF